MRNHHFIIILLSLTIGITAGFAQQAQEQKSYYAKMKYELNKLKNASSYDTYHKAAESLKTLALEEDSKWIPYYHAAYAHIMTAFLSKEKYNKEEMLNQAQNLIDKANKLSPNNHEIIALQGFLYHGRIAVNPQQRMIKYSQMAVKEYDHARFMNENNPRPYFLIGQILMSIPKEVGGNKESACKHFVRAAEKFKTFEPRSDFSPNWGQKPNQILMKKCQN